MKKVLIISPFFPPVNAADMHRVRQALPYFKELGWHSVIISVDEACIESYSNDALLLHTIPEDTEVHKVKALPVSYTRKIGLGSLSIRSYWQIKKKGNELLKKEKFDLVFFSTTGFHVMALGPYWKRKFKVPFIVDIQDPWRNDFYLNKPSKERPPKFFIAYNIDKYLEAKTIPFADGIVSVSQAYCDTFKQRYHNVTTSICKVIPFGVSEKDIEVMRQYVKNCSKVLLPDDKINIVYAGRGGYDMAFASSIIFKAFAKGLQVNPVVFNKVHFWFIGTSYATAGHGSKTIEPVAAENNVDQYVTEITDRLPYFETLYLLNKADLLIVPGSTDISYTASKIFPYIILEKKMLSVFNENSSVVTLLRELKYGELIAFNHLSKRADEYVEDCLKSLSNLLSPAYQNILNNDLFEPYKAEAKTKTLVAFFNQIVKQRSSL